MKKVKKNAKIILLILLSITIVSSLLFVYACFAPYGRHEVSDTEPFITEEFLPKPDSIAVIKGGIATEVSDEKRDRIYEEVQEILNECLYVDGYWCSARDTKRKRLSYVFYTGLEFRYNQRVQSKGKILFKEFPEYDGWPENPKVFDAFLLTIGPEGNRLIMSTYLDGEYHEISSSVMWLQFEKQTFLGFEQRLKEILE